MQVDVTITYLEMTSISQLRPRKINDNDFKISEVKIPLPEYNRFFYTAVGGDYYWVDRLKWNHKQWLDWLQRPEVHTWAAYYQGTPAGYFELEEQPDNNVEVAYFGLIPQFSGRGLGGHLLTVTIEKAWALGAQRVWVHTCSLDSPAALQNYEARGFRVYREDSYTAELPETPPGPWPNAR